MKEFLAKYPVVYNLARLVHSIPRRARYNYKRHAGASRLKKAVKQSPLRIVVGSSGLFDNKWTPTDIESLDLTNPQDWKTHFAEDSIDAILSEHVWEHLSPEGGLIAAKNCFKYMKPGGYLRVAVPDGLHPSQEYIDSVKIGGHGEGAYDHKVLFTYQTFSEIFEKAGFKVRLLEYFDEKGNFHYQQWSINQGKIHRSSRFDDRNKSGELRYTSLIIDAQKAASD